MTGIYKITNSKGRVYIGQAVSLQKRKTQYQRYDCKNQPRLYNSLVKYGFSEHIFEIVEECKLEELNIRERHWQDFYNVLGKSGLNCKLQSTLETKAVYSKESREKQSKSHTGEKQEASRVEKRAAANKGKKRTDEQKERISVALQGIPKTEAHKAALRVPKKQKQPYTRVICPHCQIEGGTNVMKRWHFEKCKEKVG
jgi:group I intron endonuclease